MYLLNQLNLISKWIINSAEGTKSQESIPKDLKDLHNFAFLLKAKHNASPSVQEIRQFYKNDLLSFSTSTNKRTNLQFAGAAVNASVHVLQNPPISSLNYTATAITPNNTANMLISLKYKSNFVHIARVHLPLKSASNLFLIIQALAVMWTRGLIVLELLQKELEMLLPIGVGFQMKQTVMLLKQQDMRIHLFLPLISFPLRLLKTRILINLLAFIIEHKDAIKSHREVNSHHLLLN
jgi:hypothetical protein